MIDQIEPVTADLIKIVGDAYVRPGADTNIIDGLQPRLVVMPGTPTEVTHVLRFANDHGLQVAPQGGGTKQGWGNRPQRIDIVLSTHRLNHVLEHAWGDMTATVQAGCTVARFQQTLAAHGQRLALDPLWPEAATIGGVIATNDSGALRVRFGSVRDLILGVTVALPDGTLARSGGKVVKNVAGYDLPKLMTGALGTLGVIVDATFRLYPIPEESIQVTLNVPTTQSANELLLRILDSTLVPSKVQCFVSHCSQPNIIVGFEGSAPVLDAQRKQLQHLIAHIDTTITADEESEITNREFLWRAGRSMMVCKTSILPNQLHSLTTVLLRIARPLRLEWELLAQAVGVGLLRIDAANDEALLAAANILRNEIKNMSGSIVVLDCQADVKARIDVWGNDGTALPLMRRVREHFDPNQILNRDRFLRF